MKNLKKKITQFIQTLLSSWKKPILNEDEEILFELNKIWVGYYFPTVRLFGYGLRYRYMWGVSPDNVVITNQRILLSADLFGKKKYVQGNSYPFEHAVHSYKLEPGFWGTIEHLTLEKDKNGDYLLMEMNKERSKYKFYTDQAHEIYNTLISLEIIKSNLT